jgi:mono/diheme cytochrome c family protein
MRLLGLILSIFALLAVGTVAVLGLRGQTSREPPVLVFDDMVNQARYRNQGESAAFADGRMMRMPPAGTVAYGRSATTRPDDTLVVTDADFFGAEDMPVAVDHALLVRGRELFNINCSRCHGEAGNGQGITTEYGMINPPSYWIARLRSAKDGYIYQVVTEGKGMMPPYAAHLRSADRWAVIAYVRALQRAHSATMSDVPEAHRGELTP